MAGVILFGANFLMEMNQKSWISEDIVNKVKSIIQR